MSKTISEKRIQAARANGAKSRGPITPQGKANSSHNAIRHGLLAASVLVGEECRQNFKSVLELLVQRFQPADGVELAMIEELAASTWRLRRVWAMESEMLTGGMQDQDAPNEITRMTAAFSGLAARPELHLLHRYETRLHMMYQRSLHNLRTMRQADMRNEPSNLLSPNGNSGSEPKESAENEPSEPNEPVFLPPGPIDVPQTSRSAFTDPPRASPSAQRIGFV
jgi:hypothetical protein